MARPILRPAQGRVPAPAAEPHLAGARARGSGSDLRATVEAMFAPARHPGLIGVELELIPVTDTPLPRPVAPARLAPGFEEDFIRAAVPSFEPGGQLELSPPPRSTVKDLVADIEHSTSGSCGEEGLTVQRAGGLPVIGGAAG